jgi:hypothetical protein
VVEPTGIVSHFLRPIATITDVTDTAEADSHTYPAAAELLADAEISAEPFKVATAFADIDASAEISDADKTIRSAAPVIDAAAEIAPADSLTRLDAAERDAAADTAADPFLVAYADAVDDPSQDTVPLVFLWRIHEIDAVDAASEVPLLVRTLEPFAVVFTVVVDVPFTSADP